MHMFDRAILSLYLGQLLSDFVFQIEHVVQQKKRNQFTGYLKHGAILFVCSVVILGFCIPGTMASSGLYAVVAAPTLAHLLIDFESVRLSRVIKSADGGGGIYCGSTVTPHYRDPFKLAPCEDSRCNGVGGKVECSGSAKESNAPLAGGVCSGYFRGRLLDPDSDCATDGGYPGE
jgi:hypothetical protein